jgi:hypothetical protein
MRHVRILPILGLAMTLGMSSVGVPFADSTAAAAAPRDKKKAADKAKTSKGTTAPAGQARKAVGYRVRIAGATLPGVNASTLSDEVEVVQYRKGNDSGNATTIATGRALVAEVTLTASGSIPRIVLDYWRAVKDGKPRKEDIAIETLDAAGAVIYQHRLHGALPRKLTTSPAKDKWTLTVAVERLDLYR